MASVPDFETLTTLPSVYAAIVKGALEAEGLTVITDGGGFESMYPFRSGSTGTRLMVPAADLERAQTIMAGFED